MSDDITGLCRDHSFETADAVCRRCGQEYCELCLVYPFGNSRPLCKECAMTEGGVRSHVQRAALGKRELRRKVKAFDARRALAAETAAAADADAVPLTDPLETADLERAAASAPPTAAEQALTPSGPQAPLSGPGVETPDDGTGPAIDWSQPFG